jgi:hypothetical protein
MAQPTYRLRRRYADAPTTALFLPARLRYVRDAIGNVSADLLVSRTSMVDVSATQEMLSTPEQKCIGGPER